MHIIALSTLFLTLTMYLTSYACDAPDENNREMEMTVFFDPSVNAKKIEPSFLYYPYNCRKLRKIIFYTEQYGRPPEDTLELFEQFMSVGSNYLRFDGFIQSQINRFIQNHKDKVKINRILLGYSELACRNHQEKYFQKGLDHTKKQQECLQKQLGITLNQGG